MVEGMVQTDGFLILRLFFIEGDQVSNSFLTQVIQTPNALLAGLRV
jgi:hypothetical protein